MPIVRDPRIRLFRFLTDELLTGNDGTFVLRLFTLTILNPSRLPNVGSLTIQRAENILGRGRRVYSYPLPTISSGVDTL